MRKNHLYLLSITSLLLFSALACTLGDTATPLAIPDTPTAATPTAPSPEVVIITVTVPAPPPAATAPPPAATDTLAPDISDPGGCTLNARYVADVTVPDDTEFAPGTTFRKVWRVRNSGTCTWEAGLQLLFVSGESLGGPAAVAVPAVAPAANTDIGVDLAAPATPGTYRSTWQLQTAEGVRFGSHIYVQIVVPEPVTETPATPTLESPTPTLPSACVATDPSLKPIWDQVQGLGYDIGCPTEPAVSLPGAFQEFWANVDEVNPHFHYRSLMIWRSDNQGIYVLDGEDTNASTGLLLAYTDTWAEGEPDVYPACQGLAPPNGYQLPIRGFGKIWCYNQLQNRVGWPAENETVVTLLVQPTQTGLLMRVSGSYLGYLVALDYRAVRGWTRMVAP
ncbi:MAG: NBR1-Ig-like domain-containing protein [Chloroflexota bacterium]|nr:NBR1-Ig-like domain-containing protein [Chloroflexota bacterium]